VKVHGTNIIRNDSGVLDPAWDCFVDNISIPTDHSDRSQDPVNNWEFCSQDGLVDGPHILTVSATVEKEQTFWFDNIHYLPSASVSLEDAAVWVDSPDSQLQYGAGWQPLQGDAGIANMTSQLGANLTFDFTGTLSSFFCLQFSDGRIQVYP
jgi:hypothetical protein